MHLFGAKISTVSAVTRQSVFPILAVVRDSLLLQNIQMGSEIHTASYSVVSGVLSWLGHEVNGSPPSSAQVKNECSYITNPCICLHEEERDIHSIGTCRM